MKVKCPDCGKLVRDKPLLGTLHICLLPEEIEVVRRHRALAEMQKRATQAPSILHSLNKI
jgi:hypothetical protein